MTIRVLLADDHAPIRAGVRDALESAGFTVCADVANAWDAIEAARVEQPHVCLLDIEMPGSGLHAVSEILAVAPCTNVLMLTVSETSEDLTDALRAGANGYLIKDITATRLVESVRSAADGDVVLDRELQTRLVRQFRAKPTRSELRNIDGEVVTLTPREWDVMELLTAQLSTAEISRRLFLRPVTVRRHVADVVHKFHVSTRAEAVKLFAQRTS